MVKLLVRAAVNALGLWLCVLYVPGIVLLGTGARERIVAYYLVAGAILALVNFVVRPIVVLLSIPFYILTLGLFFIVVNAAMLRLTSLITEHLEIGIWIDSFRAALIGGILVGVVNMVVDAFLPEEYRRR
ncbi:MAG: phage holin family protein [Actinomycetaceae bacterium]|nr:phage holin family protein [Actinomycetaceae bacterium]